MVRATTTAQTPRLTPAAVLLRRRGLLYVPEPPEDVAVPDPLVAVGVTLLEADLLELGVLLNAPLRHRLERTDPATLTVTGLRLLADVEASLGADRRMEPLFRGFPDAVPDDTLALWVDRMLTLLAQAPGQPCVLCGEPNGVQAVAPCAHLVCRSCFDGADYTACPICYRALDPDDPFLLARPDPAPQPLRSRPGRARVVGAGDDILADAHAEVATLLQRPSALSPQDRDDLLVLLETHDRGDLAWLPDPVPARETNALVLNWLLDAPEHWSVTLPEVGRRLGTATDALRLLVVRSGGDAGLARPGRFGPLPRAVRRTVLAALDRLDPRTLVEDLRRHARLWRHAAERLHPFEYVNMFPVAAAGFAAVRGTRIDDARPADGTRPAGDPRPASDPHPAGDPRPASDARRTGDVRLARAVARAGLPLRAGRVSGAGYGARVEALLAQGDVPATARLLATRPGELVRRLNALLTREPAAVGAVVEALRPAVRSVAPAVLLAALGALRARAVTAPAEGPAARVIFPKGTDAKAHVQPDERAALPAEVVDAVTAVLVAELLERCAALDPVEVALVETRLNEITAPFTQRVTSRALVTLPRGSRITVPPAERIRLFLHWMQSTQRVDLDLSVAIFDAEWNHIGTCDYTSLRWEETAAIHSGDRTDAPPPDGATEFLDLDLAALTRHQARYLVVSVFSYNNVAFDDMAEAFAGFMALSDPEGPAFDPRAVEQRFDLAGRARLTVPFVLDLTDHSLRWLDLAGNVTGTSHAVHRHLGRLARMGWALTGYFASPARVRLGELALWHAAARARTVVLRRDDATTAAFTRRPDEPLVSFVERIAAGREPDPADAADATDAAPAGDPAGDAADQPGPAGPDQAGAGLAFLYEADVPVAAGAAVYALFPTGLDPATVRRLSADDLVAALVREADTDEHPAA